MRILLLADLHIGAVKDYQYTESILDQIFQKELIKSKTDLVVILGDYFDRLFKANEPALSSAVSIMSHLVRACTPNHTPIRIVYGTESHEMNQYPIFSHFYTSPHLDFRVINTQTEETINNHSILYIPEEYMNSKEQFYSKTLYSKHYDYVFGHGTIIDGFPPSFHFQTTKTNSTPLFNSKELSEHSTITAFGHYHIHKDISTSVHYVGSLFRWKFGEEEPKGYAVIEDDLFIFIPNPHAYTYKTYEITGTDEEDIRHQIQTIESENPSIFRNNIGGKVKLIFNSTSTNPSIYEKIRTEVLRSNQIATDLKLSTPSQETTDDTDDDDSDLLEIIMSRSISDTEKIRRFLEDKKKIILTAEAIESYITKTLDF